MRAKNSNLTLRRENSIQIQSVDFLHQSLTTPKNRKFLNYVEIQSQNSPYQWAQFHPARSQSKARNFCSNIQLEIKPFLSLPQRFDCPKNPNVLTILIHFNIQSQSSPTKGLIFPSTYQSKA